METGQGQGTLPLSESGYALRHFTYAGPVARAYELSEKRCAFIVGPTGGGKSTASARKVLRAALIQHPSPIDGVRKCRIVVVTPTYRKAWETVIPSWRKVARFDGFTGAKNSQAQHEFTLNAPLRGGGMGKVAIEVWFRATNDLDLEEFVRGIETTGWWLPEADTLESEHLLSLCMNRVGRYPDTEDRPGGAEPAWAGVFGDANAPAIGNWFYKRFYLKANRKPDDAFFRQPGGFSPDAENMENLSKIRPDYYEAMSKEMEDYDVGRLIDCKPGYSRFGKPVHPLFDDERNVAKQRLDPIPGARLEIGADAGNTLMPAATFGQRAWNGQQRVLAEIAPVNQMDIVTFGQEIRRIYETRFGGKGEAVIWVDPSANAKSAANMTYSYAAILQNASGIAVQLAPTNDPLKRRSALDLVLKANVGAAEPAYLVDPGCLGLIEALAGGYRFKKVGDHYAPQPDKSNEHSHIADAEQYRMLGANGLAGGSFIAPWAGDDDHGSITAF